MVGEGAEGINNKQHLAGQSRAEFDENAQGLKVRTHRG